MKIKAIYTDIFETASSPNREVECLIIGYTLIEKTQTIILIAVRRDGKIINAPVEYFRVIDSEYTW